MWLRIVKNLMSTIEIRMKKSEIKKVGNQLNAKMNINSESGIASEHY